MIALNTDIAGRIMSHFCPNLSPTDVIQGDEAAIEALILILTQLKAIWPARHIPLLGPFLF